MKKDVRSLNESKRAKLFENVVTDPNVCSFMGTMLHASLIMHMYHLQTPSYAQHVALNDFYTKSPDLADAVIEAFQGSYNAIIAEYPNAVPMVPENPVEYLKSLKAFIIERSNMLFSGLSSRAILAEIDVFVSLIDSTLYKLTKLS